MNKPMNDDAQSLQVMAELSAATWTVLRLDKVTLSKLLTWLLVSLVIWVDVSA